MPTLRVSTKRSLFRTLSLFLAGASALGLGTRASADVIVNDGFDVLTHPTGSRSVAVGTGIPFYTRFAVPGNGNSTIATDAAVGGASPSVLSVTAGTASSFPVIGLLPGVASLVNTNDNVTLTFRFRFLNPDTATDGNSNFRFGIHGSNGTPVTGDNSGASDNDQGYYAQIGDAIQTNTNLLYRESGGTSPILAGIDRAVTTSSDGFAAITDSGPHTGTFSVTRTSPTTIVTSVSVDGGAAVTGSFTTLYTSLDEIAFSDGFTASASTQLNFEVDDVQVSATSFVAPEPAGFMVLSACGLGGLLRRRRGRQA
jgi:hypothetical protein